MTFFTRALAMPLRRVKARQATRKGQINSEAAPTIKANNRLRNDPRKAKPAPGPI